MSVTILMANACMRTGAIQRIKRRNYGIRLVLVINFIIKNISFILCYKILL